MSEPKNSQEKEIKRKLIANRAKCRKCGDIITSKHRHDFVWCKCESIFVDGGVDYIRRGGELELIEDMCVLEEE
jgi:hypothetical protein